MSSINSGVNRERLTEILIAPIVTEKSSNARMEANQIVFRVCKNATKLEIKHAVEHLLKAKVKNVSTLNVKGKVKGKAPRKGRRPDWKKAYVSLQPGQDIDLPGMQ